MSGGPVFVGREQELRDLEAAISQSEGRLILLVGEAGRGKSALLEKLHRRLGQCSGRFSVLYRLNGNDSSDLFLPRLMADLLSVEGFTRHRLLWRAPGQAEKFRGWIEAAADLPGIAAGRSLAGLLGLLLPDDKRPARDRFLDFLRYASYLLKDAERLVLAFDPEKHLDESVEADWGSLARDLPDKVTVIFAQRPDDVLAKSEALVAARSVSRIPGDGLGYLSRAESDQLIIRVWTERADWCALAPSPPPEVSAVLWGKYRGWALPLSMVLEDLPSVPAALADLVAAAQRVPRKLADLLGLRYRAAAAEDGNVVRMLWGLAVLGRPASCTRLAALYPEHDLDAAALASLSMRPVVARCLRTDGNTLDLFHACLGEFILEQLSDDSRRDLHGRAATLCERELAADPLDVEALDDCGPHLYEAGRIEDFLVAALVLGPMNYPARTTRSWQRDLLVALDILKGDTGAAFFSASARRLWLAKVLGGLAMACHALGELAAGVACAREALATARSLKDQPPHECRRSLIGILNTLGSLLWASGKVHEARGCYEEALVTWDQEGDPELTIGEGTKAELVDNLASVLRLLGDVEAARQRYEEAARIWRRLSQSDQFRYARSLALTLNNLGDLLHALGDPVGATACLTESLDLYRELARRDASAHAPDLARVLNNYADLLDNSGRADEAERLFKESLMIRRALADSEPAAYGPHVATTLANLGNLCHRRGRRDEARGCLEEALAIRRDLTMLEPSAYRADLAASLNDLGILVYEQGDAAQARACLTEALPLVRVSEEASPGTYTAQLASTLYNLGCLLYGLGETPEASECLRQAVSAYCGLVEAGRSSLMGEFVNCVWSALAVVHRTGHALQDWPELEAALETVKRLTTDPESGRRAPAAPTESG